METEFNQTSLPKCCTIVRKIRLKSYGVKKKLVDEMFAIPRTIVILLLMVLILEQVVVREALAFRHSDGLNRWSFLSNEGHELYSDLLCPNPMLGGNENRIISSSSSRFNSSTGLIVRGDGGSAPVPNDIWALKTFSDITFLPCDLKPMSSILHNNKQLGYGSNGVENKILFMNMSFLPFDFEGANAKICSKFIKLQFDEDEGVELACDDNPLDVDAAVNHIYWPRNMQKRKKSFAIFRNLERFLQNEENLRKKFFFQIYFTSSSGQTSNKKCTVQQYELNLASTGCNSRRPPSIESVCGEFSCDDLIFPFYGEDNRIKFIWKSGETTKDGKPVLLYPTDYVTATTGKRNSTRSFFNFRTMDIRLVVFLTVVPIVVVGMLIFSLEIIIYISCARRSRNSSDSTGARSQQILQNSLNLWESIPNNRESRSVSFSPVTTNIDLNGSESPAPDAVSRPRVLKSALKKSTDNLPPPPASFFELEREYPPTYAECLKH